MALAYDGAIQRLIDAFAHLPGIGPKGAQRIAFYLLNASDEEAQTLVDAITEVKEKIRFCDICGNVCEASPCPVCADPRRDHSVICVVEEPKDVMSIERTREYRGLYHVLGGVINPMANVQPSDLNIAKLIERLKDSEVTEVILALNPNVEGEATTSFLSQCVSANRHHGHALGERSAGRWRPRICRRNHARACAGRASCGRLTLPSSHSPHPLHCRHMLTIAQTLRGRSWKTPAERMYEKTRGGFARIPYIVPYVGRAGA